MKSYYCKRLYEEINFDAEEIYVCCGKALGPKFPTYKSYCTDHNVSYDDYIKQLIKWRKNCAKQAFLGKISPECSNCVELKEYNYNYIDYIKKVLLKLNKQKFSIANIIVKSFRQCELTCAYCLEKRYTKGKKTLEITQSEFYSFIPIFEALIKNKMVNTEELKLEIQGGSISVWDEFEKLLKIAVKAGVKNYWYHANAVKYLPIISEIAKDSYSEMSIAIDSGCKETYQKIKGDDKFDDVVENIIKYANNNIKINVKYILTKNLNDNKEEIEKFCNTVLSIRNKIIDKNNVAIILDIDFRDSLSGSDYQIPEKYIDIFRFVFQFGKQNNIIIGMQDFIREKIEKVI